MFIGSSALLTFMSEVPPMALFDAKRVPDVAPSDAVVMAHRFVMKCREWALELEIPKIAQRFAADPSPDDAAKLHAWTSYVAFLDHTLRELEEGTLDGWFLPAPPDR